jgi:putative MATE family efflux protein
MSNLKTASPLTENKMGVMPVGRLLVNMATPMIIAMLVQAFYNVVDSYFVSRITEYKDFTDETMIRESAIAAMSLAFAVQNVLIGFAVGIGVGVNALLSKSLGEGNQQRANFAAGNGMTLAVIATALFMVFGVVGTKPYFSMMSNVDLTVEFGTQYISIICLLSLGIFIEVLAERLLQASGRTMYTMVTQGLGAITNIVLDPLLIFGIGPFPQMGIAGAAVATVAGQWVAATLALIFNITSNPDVKLSPKYIQPKGEIIKPVMSIGVPSMIMNSVSSVMNFSMNQILMGFEGVGEIATGIFGIYYKLQSFFFMPLFGLNNETISIVAYNYGARKPERMTKTLKIACITAFTIMMLGLAAFQLMPEVLLSLFNASDTFMAVGTKALRTISLHFPVAAFCIALGASFQALGNGIYSTITALCRQMVALLPAAYLLSLTGNVDAVWWSFPIAELVSLAATLFFFTRIYRKKIKPMYCATV